MKRLNIRELLSGCEITDIPNELDLSTPAKAMPLCEDVTSDALLFLTERVNKENDAIDLSSLSTTPAAVVVSSKRTVENAPCPIIRVTSARVALSYAIANQCSIDFKKIKFIGVTGTNGKTTTATLIYNILARCGYRVGFIGTGRIESCGKVLTDESYSMTTPDPTLLYPSIKRMQLDECEYVVMEVSSHSIALGKIAPIQFEYAIFTNLDNDHLDFHRSKEEYFKTKLSLFSKAKHGLFNVDDEYGKRAYDEVSCEKTSFGIKSKADAYATALDAKSLEEISFFYREPELIFKARTRLCGAFNAYNVLAALKCVIDLGIKPCLAKEALYDIDGVDGRMEIIDGRVRAVIDYAHTPMAFYNCLKTLKSSINAEQKLIVLFGCGGDRDRGKRSAFGEYADIFADVIVITEDNSRSEAFETIAADITSGIKKKGYKIIKDREAAIRYAIKAAARGDVVALIGKGHERYKITDVGYTPFDEREIVRDAMREDGVIYASRA